MLKKLRKAGLRLSAHGHTQIFPSLLRRIFRRAGGMIEIDDFDGDLTMRISLSEHMQRRIFWMGYYNRDIVALLDKIIEKNMTIIDAGANIGEIALVAAKRTGPAGRVIAFEPIEQLADQLQSHIDLNRLAHVSVIRACLSDRKGTARIYNPCLVRHKGEENHGLGGLYGVHTETGPTQPVELTTLDHYLRAHPEVRVDIIKIDIEGSELPCLKGAKDTLEQFSPDLIVEVQKDSALAAGYREEDILDYLSALGYSFYRIGHGGVLLPVARDNLKDYQNVFCRAAAK